MSKQTEYSATFIRKCELLFQDIRENKPLKICIEKLREAQESETHSSADASASSSSSSSTIFEPLWFIYYMYFAIHNPKLEEYINMKHAAGANDPDAATANILKNMIRRRAYTSTLVFQLYMYANIQNGTVTYIYPASASVLKSLTSCHLKTAAVVIHKQQSIETIYADYIANASLGTSVSPSRLSHIKYTRKDIILLALVCYMKIDEIDINTKGIFISATKEEIEASPSLQSLQSPQSPYDEKYKYLLT